MTDTFVLLDELIKLLRNPLFWGTIWGMIIGFLVFISRKVATLFDSLNKHRQSSDDELIEQFNLLQSQFSVLRIFLGECHERNSHLEDILEKSQEAHTRELEKLREEFREVLRKLSIS